MSGVVVVVWLAMTAIGERASEGACKEGQGMF